MPEPRVLLVADSDSYLKWAAALSGTMPSHWNVRLVLVHSNAEPSAAQVAAALAGTRFDGHRPTPLTERDLTDVLRLWEPDVLVLAARGPTVQAVITLVPNDSTRPVLVSGLAGISIPVLPLGLGFRRAVDVFLVQSRRELADFSAVTPQLGLEHRFELATLPLLQDPPQRSEPDRIVFAAQSLVPREREQRLEVVQRLADVARSHPDLSVVIKVRSVAGEAETHTDRFPYPDLLAESEAVPANLVVEGGPMRDHLRTAAALVTVSSTAALEAVAAGVPVVTITDFGVGDDLINPVFDGSGLSGTFDDVVAGRFRLPDPAWAGDNYFHDPDENTWVQAVEELLEQRASEDGLPRYRETDRTPVGALRRFIYRRTVFVDQRGETAAQKALLAAGRAIVRRPSAARELTRRIGR